MEDEVAQTSETCIKVISGRVCLKDARVKALHSQSEIHGVQVVKYMTAEGEAGNGDRSGQR